MASVPLRFPPFGIRRAHGLRCWLFGGCLFEWRRVDAWWEQEFCRWCESTRSCRSVPEPRCQRCGQEISSDVDGGRDESSEAAVPSKPKA